jgi:hypothetical protein
MPARRRRYHAMNLQCRCLAGICGLARLGDNSDQLVDSCVWNPKEIGIFATKTHLSEILDKVQRGHTFVITRWGERLAELRPIRRERRPLERGCVKNDGYWMAPDFDGTPADFADSL